VTKYFHSALQAVAVLAACAGLMVVPTSANTLIYSQNPTNGAYASDNDTSHLFNSYTAYDNFILSSTSDIPPSNGSERFSIRLRTEQLPASPSISIRIMPAFREHFCSVPEMLPVTRARPFSEQTLLVNRPTSMAWILLLSLPRT
jgi:hypothetical protein